MNGLANFGGWTVTDSTGQPWAYNSETSFMDQVRPNADFVGPMQGKGLENFIGQSGSLNGQNFTLGQGQGAGSGFGFNAGTIGALSGGLQALGGLANAYLGYKNYKMAKDQFNFQKGLANRNLANQAKTINNAYNNAAQVAAGMIGAKDAAGNYGLTDQSLVDRYAAKAREKHVEGSPIN